LLTRITAILRNFPVGSVEQNNVITNLRNITRILMQRDSLWDSAQQSRASVACAAFVVTKVCMPISIPP
jgi:hypothetical protein